MNRQKLDNLTSSGVTGDLYLYDEIGSTNDEAKKMVRSPRHPEDALFISEIQTKGRGRMGRTWQSPPQTGIWMSYMFRSHLKPDMVPGVTILAAYAVASGILEYVEEHNFFYDIALIFKTFWVIVSER